MHSEPLSAAQYADLQSKIRASSITSDVIFHEDSAKKVISSIWILHRLVFLIVFTITAFAVFALMRLDYEMFIVGIVALGSLLLWLAAIRIVVEIAALLVVIAKNQKELANHLRKVPGSTTNKDTLSHDVGLGDNNIVTRDLGDTINLDDNSQESGLVGNREGSNSQSYRPGRMASETKAQQPAKPQENLEEVGHSSLLTFKCRDCGYERGNMPGIHRGRRVRCPKCNTVTVLATVD